MSANSNAMSNLQTAFQEFLGGGIDVQGKTGGFSTVLNPTTGTYQTTIKTSGTTVKTAGLGASPTGLSGSLQNLFSSNWVLIGIALIAVLFVAVGIHRRER